MSAPTTLSLYSHSVLCIQVLKDEKKRAAYDQYGSTSQQPGFDPNSFSQAFRNGQGFGGFKDFSSGFGPDVGGGSSFFESLFGALNNGPGSRQRSRGEDLEVSVGVSFMESCKRDKTQRQDFTCCRLSNVFRSRSKARRQAYNMYSLQWFRVPGLSLSTVVSRWQAHVRPCSGRWKYDTPG